MTGSAVLKRTLAIGLAAAMAVGTVTPTFAAPVGSGTAGLKAAVPNEVTDVQWRRGRGRGVGIAAGIAAGALVGAAIAGANRPYYYGPGPYYYEPAPVYVDPGPVYVAPPPVYYEPAPAYEGVRRCWIDTDRDKGYGYWRRC